MHWFVLGSFFYLLAGFGTLILATLLGLGLALALGASQRTVQRALEELTADGKVQPVGRARARRWMAPPVPGFPTTLLLPGALPGG